MFTKVGIEGTATVELGFMGIGGSVSTDYRVGVSSELSAYYSSSALTTHNTELRNSFQIDGAIGRLNENYDNVARYYITPYIYRSQSGALVLDYMVDLDEDNDEWWIDNYGQQPDLAFILPWRYAEEKGSENVSPSKKQKTTEIQFYPAVVQPGDTVCITTRVHNYSLKTYEDWLNVKYYLGDPEMGGVEISDIYGETGSSKYSTMIYGAPDANIDFEEYLTFNWKVPDTITCNPRIYAMIDPENEVTEIHENNNKGWNVLHVFDCKDCGYIEVGVEPYVYEMASLETYPVPASDFSRVHFTTEKEGKVMLEVYNLSGQCMDVVSDEWYPAGDHEITYPVAKLEDGIYLYRLTKGNATQTARLVVAH